MIFLILPALANDPARVPDPDLGKMLGCNFQKDVPIVFDTDLFSDGQPGRNFHMVEWKTVVSPVRIDPRAAPDAKHIVGEITIPVNIQGEGILLATAGYGGLDSKGVAAEGEITFADARTQPIRLLVGEHAWPAWAGATGRMADPISVGKNAGGDEITVAARWLPLSFADTAVASVTLRARGGLDVYVVGLSVHGCGGPNPRAVANESVPSGYAFPVPLVFDLGGFRPAGLDRKFVDRSIHSEAGQLIHADGSRARFFGINLVGPAALPTVERAAAVASGIVARGYDMVRLHHLDNEQALLNPARAEAGQPTIKPEMLDRFDKLHAELSARGVVQYAEMWTQHGFRSGEGVPHPENVPGGHKMVAYLWPEWRRAQQEWFRAVYGRRNPYTGQKYADDPAIAVVEIANEDALVVEWSTGALEKLPAVHRRRLDELWTGFLRKKYGDDGKLAAAWSGGPRAGLQDGESLIIGSVSREPTSRTRTELFPTRRGADLVEFLSLLESDYFREMSTFIKHDLGFSAPIVCTTSFAIPQADRQLGACDVVDIHAYWDPIAESTAFYDQSMLQPSGRYFERLSACQEGKPCTVSEIQHTWPNRFAQEAPITWAALGARQGWSALLWFAWSHADVRDAPDGPNGALDEEGRFSSDVQMPAAAAVFHAIGEASRTWTRWWSDDGLARDLAENQPIFPPETVGITSYLSRRVRTSFAKSPPTFQEGPSDAPISGPQPWRDVTDPPVRWSPGRLVINSGAINAILGDSRATHEAPDPAFLRANFTTPVAVSLVPAVEPGAYLLTVAGRTDRAGSWWSYGVPGMLVLGAGPAFLETLRGTVDVHLGAHPSVVALLPSGQIRETVRVRALGKGWYRLDADQNTPWFGVRTGQ